MPKTTQVLKTSLLKHSIPAPRLRENFSSKKPRKNLPNKSHSWEQCNYYCKQNRRALTCLLWWMWRDFCRKLGSIYNHPRILKKSLSPVFLHAVTRGLPKTESARHTYEIYRSRNLLTSNHWEPTHIKPLTRKLFSWSWHWFIRVALAQLLWSRRMSEKIQTLQPTLMSNRYKHSTRT